MAKPNARRIRARQPAAASWLRWPGFASIASWGLALSVVACDSASSSNTPAGTSGTGAAAGGASAGAGALGNPAAGPGGAAGTGSNPTAGGGNAGAASANGGAGGSGSNVGGMPGSSGSAASAGGGAPPLLPPLVTSAPGAYWKTDGALADSTTPATVTVNDAIVGQKWEGFGAAFNELGWSFLSSSELRTQALKLLFSASDGAAFAWVAFRWARVTTA